MFVMLRRAVRTTLSSIFFKFMTYRTYLVALKFGSFAAVDWNEHQRNIKLPSTWCWQGCRIFSAAAGSSGSHFRYSGSWPGRRNPVSPENLSGLRYPTSAERRCLSESDSAIEIGTGAGFRATDSGWVRSVPSLRWSGPETSCRPSAGRRWWTSSPTMTS